MRRYHQKLVGRCLRLKVVCVLTGTICSAAHVGVVGQVEGGEALSEIFLGPVGKLGRISSLALDGLSMHWTLMSLIHRTSQWPV